VRSRQDTDRSVLKTEPPEVYGGDATGAADVAHAPGCGCRRDAVLSPLQRDLLVKGLSDIAKGVLIGAFLAQGTGKLSLRLYRQRRGHPALWHGVLAGRKGGFPMSDLEILVLIIFGLSLVGFVWTWFYTRRERRRKS
jgi:hypothetical protein